jgi:putative transposase
MRNILAHADKSVRRVVSAFIATAFAQDYAGAAKVQWRKVADQLRPRLGKLAACMDEVEAAVLAFMNPSGSGTLSSDTRRTRSSG